MTATPRPRPTVFIGSSAEGLTIAKRVQVLLDRTCQVTIWNQGVFGLGEGTLESLVRSLDDFDFAIVILTPDDLVESRGAHLPGPRDNVLFELGLFIGSLGRHRTFALYDRTSSVKLPTDLAGVTHATYEPHDAGRLDASLGAPCWTIEAAVMQLGPRRTGGSDVQESIDRASKVLSKIHLRGSGVQSTSVSRGDDIAIWYEICSSSRVPVVAWLGADCWPHYNVDQDIEVSIPQGLHRFERRLSVTDKWQVGSHGLNIGVWTGPKSIPEESLRIAAATLVIEVV